MSCRLSGVVKPGKKRMRNKKNTTHGNTDKTSAAQAWHRNDVRAAKALSLRGQSENELMRRWHREAARELYPAPDDVSEIYIDLHGLHAEEAVAYLEQVLEENATESRPIYVITGPALHTKASRGDKVGRMIRVFLSEARFDFDEFVLAGDRSALAGGVLGIDAQSGTVERGRDRSRSRAGSTGAAATESVPAEGGGAMLVPDADADEHEQDKDGGGVGLDSPGASRSRRIEGLLRTPPRGPRRP